MKRADLESERMGRQSPLDEAAHDGKVMRGKDGWLFLANDRNAVVNQHTGQFRFSPKDVQRWREVLETREVDPILASVLRMLRESS